MARYIARVHTLRSTADVFAYLSDLRNFADWDPGVVRAEQVTGDGPGPDAVYDVTVDNGGRRTTLRYTVVDWNPPTRIEVVGRSGIFTSTDAIEVTSEQAETTVTYDATLEMPFPLSLADRFLSRVFSRIGDNAAAGLERALDGTSVTWPA